MWGTCDSVFFGRLFFRSRYFILVGVWLFFEVGSRDIVIGYYGESMVRLS